MSIAETLTTSREGASFAEAPFWQAPTATVLADLASSICGSLLTRGRVEALALGSERRRRSQASPGLEARPPAVREPVEGAQP